MPVEEEEDEENRLVDAVEEETTSNTTAMPQSKEEGQVTIQMETLEMKENETPKELSAEEKEHQQDLWRQQLLEQEVDEGEESEEDEDREYGERIVEEMAREMENMGNSKDEEHKDEDENEVQNDVWPQQRREIEADSEEDDESETEEDRMYMASVRAHHAKSMTPVSQEPASEEGSEVPKSPENVDDSDGESETEEDREYEARVRAHKAGKTSEDSKESEGTQESKSQESVPIEQQQNSAENEPERQRWLESILQQKCDSKDESESEEDRRYGEWMDEETKKQMDELAEIVGKPEVSQNQETQEVRLMTQEPVENKEEEQDKENEDVAQTNEELPVSSDHQESVHLNSVVSTPQIPEPHQQQMNAPPHRSNQLNQRSRDPSGSNYNHQNSRQGASNAQIYLKGFANMSTGYSKDHELPSRSYSRNDRRAEDERSEGSSVDDDHEFSEYTFHNSNSNKNSNQQFQQVAPNPFAGVPVASFGRGNTEEQERREISMHPRSPQYPQNRERDDRRYQSVENRWDSNIITGTSNNRTHQDNSQRNYGYNPGPPTFDSHSEPRRNENYARSHPSSHSSQDRDHPRGQNRRDHQDGHRENRNGENGHSNNYPNDYDDRARDNRNHSSNHGYHPGPPTQPERRNEDRNNHRQDHGHNRPPTHENSRNMQNHGQSSSNQYHQPEKVQEQETEKQANIRREEEDRMSLKYIRELLEGEKKERAEQEEREYYALLERNRHPSTEHRQWVHSSNSSQNRSPVHQNNWPSSSGSNGGPFSYRPNQTPQNAMVPFTGQQQHYGNSQHGGYQQHQNMVVPQQNLNDPRQSQMQNYNNMQGFQNNQPPMGQQMQVFHPNQNAQFQSPGGSESGHPGVMGRMPTLNFTHQTLPSIIMRQILAYLELCQKAGVRVFISTMGNPPNQVPKYFMFAEFIQANLSSVVAMVMDTNKSNGKTEYCVYLL